MAHDSHSNSPLRESLEPQEAGEFFWVEIFCCGSKVAISPLKIGRFTQKERRKYSNHPVSERENVSFKEGESN